ncbi:MAG: hypothetical protein ACTHM0_10325 [Sphingomonas sp.]
MSDSAAQPTASVHVRCLFGVNGDVIEAVAVCMYPEPLVREWQSLMASAHAELGGSSGGTGIGFLGSPEFVLGGMALIGILGQAAANSRAKKALAHLAEAERKRAVLIDSAVPIGIASITNVDLPDPNSWIGKRDVQTEVQVGRLPSLQRRRLLRSYGLSRDDVQGGKVSVSATERFVLRGDDFVALHTADGVTAIRWSAVSSFRITA